MVETEERTDNETNGNPNLHQEKQSSTTVTQQSLDGISKNQLKKQKRHEKLMEQKKRRKLQEKEIKHAKALASGRDLEKERKELEERTAKGDGHERREKIWLEKLTRAENSFGVCVDCAFEDQMTKKEIHSLGLQLRYCYASNKRAHNPVLLSLASLHGETKAVLDKVDGFPEQWEARAFTYSDKSLEDMYANRKDKLVYLTSDSDHTLTTVSKDEIYIIGGIVDRNRLKGAAKGRADTLGIATAKLPITEHLQLVTTKVLTCNHVFEILLKVNENGNDWKQAMLDVLPQRKDATPKEESANVDDETKVTT